MNRTIRSGTRKVIHNVYMRCLAEAQAGKILSDLSDVYKRVAEMTGKSESTIRRIAEEGSKNNGVFSTPGKNRKGRPKKQLDDFDISAIRQKVHFFYAVKKEMPTLSKLQAVLREDIGYNGCREHLRKLLISIGFHYKKCQSQRSVLIEQPIIAHKRERYLKVIMDNRNLPTELQKNIIYLDESYIHSSHKLKKCWQSIDTKGTLADVSKGKRWIIVHAGSEKGFVPNALLRFSGKNKNEDYHSEMNQHNFRKWVLEKLVPNLEEPSIIVMDNAPYHSVVKNKAPTSASRIDEIKMWLQENNISFDPSLRKPSLLILAKQHKQEPIYEIDEILGEYGHTVVRLPPYHCDLNPIEQIWALAKQKIASRNVGASDIKMLTEEAFQEITENDWKNCCNHVKKIELEYYERGRTMYEDIERFIIQVTNDSETDKSHSDSEACMDIQTYSEVHRNEEDASTSMLDVQYLDYSFSD